MKRHLPLLLIVSASLIPSAHATKRHQQVLIQGTEAGQHYRSHHRHKVSYLLQLATFRHHSYAVRLQKKVAALTNYPVKIIPSHKMYRVVVGPMNSDSEIRRTSQQLANILQIDTKRHRVTPNHKTQKKVSTQTSHPTPSTTQATKEIAAPSKAIAGCGSYWCPTGYFIDIAGGANWFDDNDDLYVANGSNFPAPFHLDRFSVEQEQAYQVAVSAGQEWQVDNRWVDRVQLAILGQHVSRRNVSGFVDQYSLPQFTNYDYLWSVESNTLMMAMKWIGHGFKGFRPYIGGAVGIAQNKTSGYQEVARAGVTPRISPAFADHNEEDFTYSLQAGLNFFINEGTRIGVGYEFQDFGKASSGPGAGSWSNSNLNLPKLQSSAVVVNIQKMLG